MAGFKKPGGFNRNGNPRTQRAEQSSYDGNQGQGFKRRGHSDRPRFGGGSGGFSRSENTGSNPRTQRAEPRLGKSLAGLRFVRQSQSSWTKREQSSYDGRDSSRPQMFSAVCSECNRACEVPFRPTGDRPVFCRDCFGGKRGASRAATPERDFSRRDFTPSAPSSKSPVEDKRIDDLKRQLDAVNKKLDAMMEMMQSATAKKSKAKKPVKVKK